MTTIKLAMDFGDACIKRKKTIRVDINSPGSKYVPCVFSVYGIIMLLFVIFCFERETTLARLNVTGISNLSFFCGKDKCFAR